MACRKAGAGDDEWQDGHKREGTPPPSCNLAVTDEALSNVRDIIPVLIYLSGYAVYAALKRKLKCAKYRAALAVRKPFRDSIAQKRYDHTKSWTEEACFFVQRCLL